MSTHHNISNTQVSGFRTVVLADFMSYLDVALVNFEEYVFQYNAETLHSHYKKFVIERTSVIKALIVSSDASLFNLDMTVGKTIVIIFCGIPLHETIST